MELKAFRGEVESRFEQVNARFDRIESQLNRMESKIDQILALMQAQEDRNRYVLDGYASGRQRRSS